MKFLENITNSLLNFNKVEFSIYLIDLLLWIGVIIYSIHIYVVISENKGCLRLNSLNLISKITVILLGVLSILYIPMRFYSLPQKLSLFLDHYTIWMVYDYFLGILFILILTLLKTIYIWNCNRNKRCLGNTRIPYTIEEERFLLIMRFLKLKNTDVYNKLMNDELLYSNANKASDDIIKLLDNEKDK